MNRITHLDCLREFALSDGNRTALVDNNGIDSLSYATFDKLSDAIAEKIIHAGICPGDTVAVMMYRDAVSIAAEVAVLKAGAVFVPLMPSYPEERVAYICNDCIAKLMIDQSFYKDLPETVTVQLPVPPCADRVMVIYTSGSTGHPKGVVYDLAAYNAAVDRMTTFLEGIYPVVLGAFAPMAFVGHPFEFAAVFAVGGTIHVLSDEIRMDPVRLENYYRANRISVGFSSSKLFCRFRKFLPDLKLVLFGGERIADVDPGPYKVVVSYSQTEAMDMLRYRIDEAHSEAFIGMPSPGTDVFLLDEQGHEVGDLQEGEICSKGIYPRRYLNLDEESRKHFEVLEDGKVIVHTGDIGIRHPNGQIEYINRRDFMVKINGNKVEPGEIERALRKIPSISDAVVRAFTKKNGQVFLCGYYISENELASTQLKETLGRELPPFMVPAYFIRMDRFPTNTNGKLDRNSLPEPEQVVHSANAVVPVTEDEIRLCQTVEEVLGLDAACMDDDFFSLGGDSLQAAMLVSALSESGMGVLEVSQVYEHPRLSDLLSCLQHSRLVGNSDYTILSPGKDGCCPLAFFHTANMGSEAYTQLAQNLPPEIPFLVYENHNLNYPDIPIRKITSLVEYDLLESSDWFAQFARKGMDETVFGGWSFGGTAAFEAALQSERMGRKVAGVVLLDPFLTDEKDKKQLHEGVMDPNLKKYFREEALFGGSNSEAAIDAMFRNNQLVANMLMDYTPSGMLDAEVLFIKASIVRDTDLMKKLCHAYPANGYEKYCRNIRIVTVDCNHDELGNHAQTLRMVREFVMEKCGLA